MHCAWPACATRGVVVACQLSCVRSASGLSGWPKLEKTPFSQSERLLILGHSAAHHGVDGWGRLGVRAYPPHWGEVGALPVLFLGHCAAITHCRIERQATRSSHGEDTIGELFRTTDLVCVTGGSAPHNRFTLQHSRVQQPLRVHPGARKHIHTWLHCHCGERSAVKLAWRLSCLRLSLTSVGS
jgi:hypothetical protein